MNHFQYMALGFASSTFSNTICAPLERLKLLQQNENERIRIGDIKCPSLSITDCLIDIIRSEGLCGLYKGNLLHCARYTPVTLVNILVKPTIAKSFRVSRRDPYLKRFFSRVISGTVVGAISLACIYPLDASRALIACGCFDSLYECIMQKGTSIYTGYGVSLFGIALYRALYFGIYDVMKSYFPETFNQSRDALLISTLSGFVCFGVDTIRRRMILASATEFSYKGALDCFLNIVRNEGVTSLWRGADLNLYRGIMSAVSLMIFNACITNYVTHGDVRHHKHTKKKKAKERIQLEKFSSKQEKIINMIKNVEH